MSRVICIQSSDGKLRHIQLNAIDTDNTAEDLVDQEYTENDLAWNVHEDNDVSCPLVRRGKR